MPERDSKGRFLKGHSLKSPGRPKKATEAEYLEAMGRGVPVDIFERASAKMGKMAVKGDVQAYNAIKAHLAGLPVQRLQLSSQDVALLAELLQRFDRLQIAPSEVFEAMIEELAGSEGGGK